MKSLPLLLLLPLLLPLALTSNGIDLSTLTTQQNFQCLVDNYGITFMVMRGYRSYGAIDPNVRANLQAAQDAGIFFTDVYLFPCATKSPVDQANELIDHLGEDIAYGYIWVDVETNNSPGCQWGKDFEVNCKFLVELVAQIKKRGKAPGIYASAYMWNTILGAKDSCVNFKDLPLWYAHYDNVQSFSDFTPFGGWEKPNTKQYKGTTTLCNTGVDLDWYPQCSHC
jgi:GH25 family lysozyme M1 (1,4-beta-N-acetylmuramidase)